MSEYGQAAHAVEKSPVSIAWVVVASALAGIGIFGLTYFLYTFQLIYLGAVLPLLTGALMMFDRRAGADRAP